MVKIDIKKTELVWPGKYDEDGKLKEVDKINLPFQVIESINTSRADRDKEKNVGRSLYDFFDEKQPDTFEEGWKNKLIWGDNKLIMSSLLKQFAGKIDLIYIDPPFAIGLDFSYKTEVGDSGKEILKEQSIIEEKAYRDTWGGGIHYYLNMMRDRLLIMKDLLSAKGSIYVHSDWRVSSFIRFIMDEIFGEENFCNEIVWKRGHTVKSTIGTQFPRGHDTILFYSKFPSKNTFNPSFGTYSEGTLSNYNKKDEKGIYRLQSLRTYGKNSIDEFRKNGLIYETGSGKIWLKQYLTDRAGPKINSFWADIDSIEIKRQEQIGYPTQKPEGLLKRIIESSSCKGDLVADFFCGSGTTCAVAEKLGRRWIGTDLSRWAVHTTRKRLLEIENCKSFEILNLGKYERQYWQSAAFGKDKSKEGQSIFEYIAFILKLYQAEPISGTQFIHGKKGNILVHIGAVDSPITIDEINHCIDECIALKQKNLHMLGWEWEMGVNDLMIKEAKGKDVSLTLLTIPREVMEKQAVEKGDVKFFELAHVDIDFEQKSSNKLQIKLKDFAMSNSDLIPNELKEKIKKWSDYIDYWAVDWDFKDDTFINGWVSYRTKQDRILELSSDTHQYTKSDTYKIMVKVVDIFGNDTSNTFEVKVK